MSEYNVPNFGCVSNAKVYGLDESIKRAKYPMSTIPSKLTNKLTPGIKSLAQSKSGAGHDQWLTGVITQFDLSFSNKAWVEAERYHFFDFVSSQSTMHRIIKFDLNDTYNIYVDWRIVDIIKEKIEEYNGLCDASSNVAPEDIQTKYLEILYSNPAGFILTAGMTTNYRQLKTIYNQRKNHRLPEWRTFCSWMETLPHSELITGNDKEELEVVI